MRILWTLLIVILTIYAPIELTRVIIRGLPNSAYWGIPVWQFLLEIAIFWLEYIAGMIIVYKKLRR